MIKQLWDKLFTTSANDQCVYQNPNFRITPQVVSLTIVPVDGPALPITERQLTTLKFCNLLTTDNKPLMYITLRLKYSCDQKWFEGGINEYTLQFELVDKKNDFHRICTGTKLSKLVYLFESSNDLVCLVGCVQDGSNWYEREL